MKDFIIKILKAEFPDKKIISAENPVVAYGGNVVAMQSVVFVGQKEVSNFTDLIKPETSIVFVYAAELTISNHQPALVVRSGQL